MSNNTTEALEKATLEFFPEEGNWYSNCFRKSKDLNIENLPCNLRNDKWLAIMLKIKQNLIFIDNETVLKYVKTSNFFKEKRHEYEQKIVKLIG